jgi:hypothetical protein
MKLIDRTGDRYERLVVLEKSPTPRMWLCRCDCGTELLVTGPNLASGNTRSCGCLLREWSKHLGGNPEYVARRAEKAVHHGQKRRGKASPEYKTWLGMKARCYTPSNKDYPNWGGRGIAVCDRWRNDFPSFLADMGTKPTPAHTIDRLKSDEDYGPDNCRWATLEEQGGENRRGLQPIVVQGLAFATKAEACRHFGVGATTVNERLKAGIPVDMAFTPGALPSRRTRESYIRKDLR